MTRDEILAVAKPILFNTEKVRAILEGRKTVTRRVIKPQLTAEAPTYCYADTYKKNIGCWHDKSGHRWKPPYHAGDYLYVRETWAKLDSHYFYKAAHELLVDGEPLIKAWKPSIHMPKEAAQLFLRVTDVQAGRLQEITPKECIAEGVEHGAREVGSDFIRGMFSDIWDSTIKPADLPLYGWEANPWVWAIKFEKVEANRNA